MEEQPSYAKIYERTIAEDQNGLKLILGGTGLGKTRGISEVIKAAQTTRKFIYIANRIALLNEMGTSLEAAGVGYVHLKKDEETLLEILEKVKSFLNDKMVKTYAKPTELGQIKKTLTKLLQIKDNREALALVQSQVNDSTTEVMRFFKKILYEAYEKDKANHAKLLNEPIIRELFPFITYKNDAKTKVLLVTVQKAFYGFFDGKRNVSLTDLRNEHGKNIIFLDEYDFLENDLLDLICRDNDIKDQFKFVEAFHREMKRHKLPLIEYPSNLGEIRTERWEIEGIIALIDNLNKYGIKFPAINQFTYKQPKKDKKEFIFQTNRTIASDLIYLKKGKRSFEIVHKKTKISAFTLLNVVRSATIHILNLFKKMRVKDPAAYKEIMAHCYEYSVFRQDIEKTWQLPQRERIQATHFNKLLDSGFSLYEIQRLDYKTDEEQAKLRHYSINTTPERILLTLAQHNLVFGLSATTDIPRCLHNFSADWLREQLKGAEKARFYEPEGVDTDIITALNSARQKARANKVSVEKATELGNEQPLAEFIAGLEQSEGLDEFKKARVSHFFATLHWIMQNKDQETLKTDTHLMFFTSYKQIQQIFDQGSSEDGYFDVVKGVVEKDLPRDFDYYELTLYPKAFSGMSFPPTTFNIIFYDAKRGREIRTEKTVEEAYHKLFWQQKPVLVLTTYPSTGNGINLQYQPSEGSAEIDFKNIHLLDSPYYYFDKIERDSSEQTEQEISTIIKKRIWYLAKLYTAKIISETDFITRVGSIRNNELNRWYQLHTNPDLKKDWLLNQLAIFIQALGRSERVWRKMPDQTVRLRTEIYDEIFEKFCRDEQYGALREQRKAIISQNLTEIFSQITTRYQQNQRKIETIKDERLSERNDKNREAVKELLERLAAFRAGKQNEAKKDWQKLRLAVLKHDFQDPILSKYYCLFKTEYYRDGKLCYNEDLAIIPHEEKTSDFSIWEMDILYHILLKNKVVRAYFESKGYELGFNRGTKQFFTPYTYQAILAGAIGEEAIKALLEKKRIRFEEICDSLFEVIDLKIADLPWYIDCKNYSEDTLNRFSLSSDDLLYRPKLNDKDFKESAKRKLKKIQTFHSAEPNLCKLIYLNFVGHNDRIKRYYDCDFNDVGHDFQAAKIIVIQGVLDQSKPETFCEGFEKLLTDLQNPS